MLGKVFGIVTDAEKFYFMECSLDDQASNCRNRWSLYNDEIMENIVRKVLSHIVWLLEEVQKPVEVSQSDVRSSLQRTYYPLLS
jgi:hypothetical protein